MLTKLEKLLIKHEGLKLKPYKCSAGKTTIGVGRNLDDNGISEDEAYFFMHNDVATCEHELNKFEWFQGLDQVRQDVLIDMAFNLGIPRLLGFKNMIIALKEKNFSKVANEMMNSKWCEQVKNRAFELSQMMISGEYPYEL